MAMPETLPASKTALRLRTNLADYPVTLAVKDGRVRSDLVQLDFLGPKTAHDGFKPMLREGAFDLSEMATATFLLAKAHGKPYVLIPAPTAGRLQHGSVVYNRERGELDPRGIEGRKVGVRAYSQTTGLWARGILRHDHGVDLDKVTWVTVEEPHVAEYQDPPNCERLPPETSLLQKLFDGEIAAGILGYGIPDDPRIARLIPDAEAAGRRWQAREGIVPLNHMLCVHADIARAHPQAMREIYRMMGEGRAHAPEAAAKLPPMGFEANRKGLEMAIDWAVEQKILQRRLPVESLFDETTGSLN